ncbi:MAG: hypothetical protein DRJ51_02240 [Thermoprotei archaeon]|nr:MAG: hypothetical protein DRJ51_02240 [Thermoprotei archaeon]
MSVKELYFLVESTVDRIGSFKIYSSTDVVFEGLKLVCEIFDRASTLEEAVKVTALAVKSLVSARPTSVMLLNSLRRMLKRVSSELDVTEDLKPIRALVREEYRRLRQEIVEASEAVASIGSRRISDGDVILTNSYSKTVLGVLRKAKERGVKFQVYVVESRPGAEGLLTAAELNRIGVPITLFVDSAVRYFMKDVDKVLVSAEAIAANGAVVNKVGTSLIALAAHEARVRVFVAASTLKFSPETIFGELVKITLRPAEYLVKEAVENLRDLSAFELPIFDVTPPEYIDAIITEKGVVAPEAVILLVREIYGWPPRLRDINELIEEIERKVGLR